MERLRLPADRALSLGLAAFSLLILLRTLVPTIYTLDSAELLTGAWTQGIVHAPGYPLYLILLRLVLSLPAHDPGWLGNLSSALCLALSVAILFLGLRRLDMPRGPAACSALVFAWSYQVWLVGLFTEVYAPQILTIAFCLWTLAGEEPGSHHRAGLLGGLAWGLALAIHPSSALLLPGVAVAVYQKHIPIHRIAPGVLLALAIILASWAYLPLRFTANPSYNLAGTYAADGAFQAVDLTTPTGLAWMLSGQQFDSLFFSAGWLPSLSQARDTLTLFATNFLGFGLVIGMYGLVVLASRHRSRLWVWLAAFVPYIYFYTTYGAGDRDLMFGPALLLWTVPFALGLTELTRSIRRPVQIAVLAGLPALLLLVNFPRADLSRETSVRERSEAFMRAAPANAIVFANWADVTPLEYLQQVEGQRPDLRLINLFLFPEDRLRQYLSRLIADRAAIWIVDNRAASFAPGCPIQPVSVPLPSVAIPYTIYTVRVDLEGCT